MRRWSPEADGEDADSELPAEVAAEETGDQSSRKRRRRGKRGGRRRARPLVEAGAIELEHGELELGVAAISEEAGATAAADDDDEAAPGPTKWRRRKPSRKAIATWRRSFRQQRPVGMLKQQPTARLRWPLRRKRRAVTRPAR
ncbi:MAG: hypothetical protein U1E38_04290 [Rhodospirillales bacterium]